MKEKVFKFKESYFKAMSNLNEKQAGRLLKGICEYAYSGKEFVAKEAALNSAFALIKSAMDEDAQMQERSEYGGNVSLFKRNTDDSLMLITADLGKQKCSLLDVMSSAFIAANTDYNIGEEKIKKILERREQ